VNLVGKHITIGVHIVQEHMDFSQVRSICKTAEELGFDSVTLMDHFRPYYPPKNGSLLECWTTLSALAMETERIKIGPLVTCASYRNPALLAKIAACLDHISGGRLKFGIGAGWFKEEFEEYGIPFDEPKERIRRLEEAIRIVKKMWIDEEVSFTGRYYKIDRATCNPKPIQKPHPPIIVGGGGERFTLRVVAKLADGWNSPGSFKRYADKLEILKRHCLEVGRDFREIKLSWSAWVILSSDRRKTAEFKPDYIKNLDDFINAYLIGNPEQCIKKMQSFIRLGVTDFELAFPDTFPRCKGASRKPSLETMRSFAELILPEFRK
jgi:F420-dependent oxidoreductase-like protein